MDNLEEEIEQEFPFRTTYFRYHVHRNNDQKPIGKFNSHYQAERFMTLMHEQEKTWDNKNYYRLLFKGKTQIVL
jgi:hypothetical protein